jgi:Tol biopolymer transport system component
MPRAAGVRFNRSISIALARLVRRGWLLVVAAALCLLATPAWASFPGRNGLIAVHTHRGEADQMWVVRPDGTGLTRFPLSGDGAFSPDGRQVALATGKTLMVTDLNGGNRRIVYRSPDPEKVWTSEPAWSPDSDFLYFGFDPIMAVPIAGGPPRKWPRYSLTPDVSVNGRVAYGVDKNYEGDSRIFTSDANAGDIRALARGSSPSWSPDGARIAFERDAAIYAANADGSNATRLWDGGSASRALESLAWSPDGGTIAFIRGNLDTDAESLALLDLATGKVRNLVSQAKLDADLLFSVEWQPLQGEDQIVWPTLPPPGRCGMLGSRTIHKTKLARIFTENDRYYGCLYATGRIVRLEEGGGISPTLGELALAGRYVGYEIESEGTDVGRYADLFVADLRSGRVIRSTNSVDPSTGSSYADVRRLVITRAGSIAWVVRPLTEDDRRLPYQVHKFDRSGARMLDSGRRIRPKSLTLHGHRISWRNGQNRRSARLR